MGSEIVNFSAGPALLPPGVLAEAQRELVDSSGMSLLEMSHRSALYEAVHENARELLRRVLGVPTGFSVLLLQGGASLQFAMVPINLLAGGGRAGFVVSGAWAAKAIAAAGHHGEVYAAWDGAADGFTRMPGAADVEIRPGTRYLHVTSNETIHGLQMFAWPEVDAPLVADMSSDILTRPIPWERFDLVYGGAQKNLGPAGVTVVVVRDSVAEDAAPDAAAYLRYGVHHRTRSLYNTPPVFAVHLLGKTLAWAQREGGLPVLEQRARRRAALLYEAIDGSAGYYRGPAHPGSRSLMNVVFRLPDEDAERQFLAAAVAAGLVGLAGHRSVGGIRASIYNAMPVSGVERLAAFMAEFRRS